MLCTVSSRSGTTAFGLKGTYRCVCSGSTALCSGVWPCDTPTPPANESNTFSVQSLLLYEKIPHIPLPISAIAGDKTHRTCSFLVAGGLSIFCLVDPTVEVKSYYSMGMHVSFRLMCLFCSLRCFKFIHVYVDS